MPKASLRISDEFSLSLAQITLDKLLQRIRRCVEMLAETPEVGSPNIRQSLRDLYGEGLRKIPVSTFVIVYRYEGDVVDVLALVYGPSVV